MSIFELLKNPEKLFDSHCHLNDSVFDIDRVEIINNTFDCGVDHIVDISIDIKSSIKSIKISSEDNRVKSFIGIDPDVLIPSSNLYIDIQNFDEWIKKQEDELLILLEKNSKNIYGIGESGMDMYWLYKDKNLTGEQINTSIHRQKLLFELHLKLAKKFNLPLSVHTRNAEQHCLDTIKENTGVYGIFHSFTGSAEVGTEVIKAGWGLGINGILTFKNASDLRDIYKTIFKNIGIISTRNMSPVDFYKKGIYFETDAPYLSPQSLRGSRNNPMAIKEIFDVVKTLL